MKFVPFFIYLLCSILSETAYAFEVEKLFMPGEVITGHKKLESDCKQCHVRGRTTTQRKLCLDCHEKVELDVLKKRGFHGKNRKAGTADCRVCHSEHKGRNANIIWLDKDRFDHDETDYKLLGKHQQTECSGCHKQGKKFREAPTVCINCHKQDDVHDNKLGNECTNCHNPAAWTSEQFDHDKTRFKLRRSHKKVACDLCHVENSYKDLPKKCVSCHLIKDVHKNRFGNKCQDCHQENKWNKNTFDHDKDTKYKLKGIHLSVTCHSCHTRTQKKQTINKTTRNCYSCHRLDDAHKGQNGKKCQDCHNEKNWLESSFDHDTKTNFTLRGAHKKASCQSCHQTDTVGEKTDTACYSCHKHQDVHKTQQGKNCDNCHNDSSWWLEDVRFDHELSNFPLVGQHAVTGCESCHLSSAFKDAKSNCNDCHKGDDIHEQMFGTDCQQCHNSNDWLIWIFDHDETEFKIEDAHKEVHCNSCHLKPFQENIQQYNECIDCHKRDDIHDGNFGLDCDKCHSQDDFKSIDIRSMRNIEQ